MKKIFLTSYLFSLFLLAGSLAAAQVLIDTDAMTINGEASGGMFNGTVFEVVELSSGIVQFRFSGDLNFPDGTLVSAAGGRALSLFSVNNITIGKGVVIDVSAVGQTPGPGGGPGGDGGLHGRFSWCWGMAGDLP